MNVGSLSNGYDFSGGYKPLAEVQFKNGDWITALYKQDARNNNHGASRLTETATVLLRVQSDGHSIRYYENGREVTLEDKPDVKVKVGYPCNLFGRTTFGSLRVDNNYYPLRTLEHGDGLYVLVSWLRVLDEGEVKIVREALDDGASFYAHSDH